VAIGTAAAHHRQTTNSPTFPNFPNFDLTNVKFANFSRFSRWVATLFCTTVDALPKDYVAAQNIKEHATAERYDYVR